MRCIDIPIDHRLFETVKKSSTYKTVSGARGEHVRILSDFGRRLHEYEDQNRLAPESLENELELARPEGTGGIAVVLYPLIDNDPCEARSSSTFGKVDSLIQGITSGTMSIDDISVFSALPFMRAYYRGNKRSHRDAVKVFLAALEAKRPDVIISCFVMGISSLRRLEHGVIGEHPSASQMSFDQSGHACVKINAFNLDDIIFHGCYRRLLILEFAQALATWRGCWEEQPWMADLRRECREHGRTCPGQKGVKFHEIKFFQALRGFEAAQQHVHFFRLAPHMESEDVYERLMTSSISSRASDLAILLREELPNRGWQSLQYKFPFWIKQFFEGAGCQMVRVDSEHQKGWFEHHHLASFASMAENPVSRNVQNIYISFLRQLNLTFKRSENKPEDIEARAYQQSCVLLCFAERIEKCFGPMVSARAEAASALISLSQMETE